MNEIDLWDRVKRGAEILGIPDATVRTWKRRGRVSREQIKPLCDVLRDTDKEIRFTELI